MSRLEESFRKLQVAKPVALDFAVAEDHAIISIQYAGGNSIDEEGAMPTFNFYLDADGCQQWASAFLDLASALNRGTRN